MRTFIIVTIAFLICLSSAFAVDAKTAIADLKNDSKTKISSKPLEPPSTDTKSVQQEEKPVISQGIQVHGNWRIEILDKDGKSVSVCDFTNDLIANHPISRMLISQSIWYGSYGGWAISLGNSTVQPCGDQPCYLLSNYTVCDLSYSANSTNLNITEVVTASGFSTIRLLGTVIAENATTIDNVKTYLKICMSDVIPSNCDFEEVDCHYAGLTATNVPVPPSVQPGQQIIVTVDIVIA